MNTKEKTYLDMRSFWLGNKPAHIRTAQERLDARVPDEGEVPNAANNPQLERWRLLGNIYYDVYNNGGGNWRNYIEELRIVSDGKITWGELIDVEECDSSCEQLMKLERLAERIFRAACKEQGISITK